jgi:hypothetical protein
MKAAKNQREKLAPGASQHTRKNQATYPEPSDSVSVLMVEDVSGVYEKSVSPELQAFRSSLPYKLMGCAQGPMSNMTDDEIKDMMIRDKYGL